MMEKFSQQANTLLSIFFKNHKITCNIVDETIYFPQNDLTIQCHCFDLTTDLTVKVIQLDVCVNYGIVPLIESCASWADDYEKAFNLVFLKFVQNAFHVILSTFFNSNYDDLVVKETWQINGKNFDVIASPLCIQGDLPKNWSNDCIEQFQSFLQQEELPDGLHWIRFFYGQNHHQKLAFEILLDNQHYLPLMKQENNFRWIGGENFYSIRLFMTAKRGNDINRIAKIILDKQEPDIIYKTLLTTGLSNLDAQKAYPFITEAFGRCLIKALGVQDELSHIALIYNKKEEQFYVNLNTEPLFTEAMRFAQTHTQNGWNASLKNLAQMSACYNAFNAISKNMEPNSISGNNFSQTIMFIDDYPNL